MKTETSVGTRMWPGELGGSAVRALVALQSFDSWHPYGGSQPPIVPVPGDPMPSNLHGHQPHTCTHIHAGKTSHIKEHE